MPHCSCLVRATAAWYNAAMTRFLLILVCAWCSTLRAQEPVRVFAAASLTDALREAAQTWSSEGQAVPTLAFGASSTLAKQIEAGAPADLFASADQSWMDHLVAADRLEPGTRVDLLGNALVLVAPKGRAIEVKLERGFDLPGAFAGRLCTGEPGVVPVGIYAQEALQYFGWWEALRTRVAGADDVRTALSFVERGECALGIVYETDARASDEVAVVARFPADSHRDIVYPFALVRGARPAARELLHWLRTAPAARAVFERQGFTWRAD
jgi:molybdate transport system substrate-binding protein